MADLNNLVLLFTKNLIKLKKEDSFLKFLRFKKDNFEDFQNCLVALYQQIEEGDFHKQRLYKEIFGASKSYQAPRMKAFLNEYLEVLQSFLKFEQLEQNEVIGQKFLLDSLKETRMTEGFLTLSDTFETTVDPKAEAEYYLYVALQKLERYFYESEDNPKDRKDLEEALRHLDIFCQITKLKINAELLIKNYKYNDENEEQFIVEVRQFPELFESSEIPLLQVLRSTVQFYVTQNQETYYELKKQFQKSIPCIYTERKNLFIFGVNALAPIYLPNELYAKEQFEWYQLADKEGLLISNNVMDGHGFVLAIENACRQNETVWARRFKKKYIAFLDVNEKNLKRIKNQSEGFLLLEEGKYEDALVELKKITATKPQFFFQKNISMLKAAYQIHKEDTFVEFDNEIAVFTSTLYRYKKNKRINFDADEKYWNFLGFLKEVTQYYSNRLSKTYLLNRLEILKPKIAEYVWFKLIINKLPDKKATY